MQQQQIVLCAPPALLSMELLNRRDEKQVVSCRVKVRQKFITHISICFKTDQVTHLLSAPWRKFLLVFVATEVVILDYLTWLEVQLPWSDAGSIQRLAKAGCLSDLPWSVWWRSGEQEQRVRRPRCN